MFIRHNRNKEIFNQLEKAINNKLVLSIDTLNYKVVLDFNTNNLKVIPISKKEIKKNKNSEFTKYLNELLTSIQETPADNLEQLLQRDSCLIIIESIIEKYSDIFSE